MAVSSAAAGRGRRPGRIIAVTGLKAEAKIAAGEGVHVIAGGGDGARLRRDIAAAAPGASAIISFGVAGGLAPGLQRGSLFVARRIIAQDGAWFDADPQWAAALRVALGAMLVDFAGVDEAIAGVHAKRALHLDTGAHLVDMESHIAADVAGRLGIPFAAVRAVADPAERHLPHAAIVAMRPDGGLALGALARSLARDPRQIAQLVHTARDARAAFKSLLRSRKLLALGFALPDFVELVLNMPAEDELGGPLPI